MIKTKIPLFFPLLALIIGCNQKPEQPLIPTAQIRTISEQLPTPLAPTATGVLEAEPTTELSVSATQPSIEKAVIEPTKTPVPEESRGISVWALMIESMGEGYIDYKEADGDDVRLEQAQMLTANAHFSNMQPDDVIRQDWYFNGELLGSSEIQWDFEKYGEESWWREATTADFEDETQQGLYELEIYLNGVLNGTAFATISPPTFSIDPIVEVSSGNKARLVSTNEIVIESPDQSEQVFEFNGRVSSIDWFPDGQRLLVTTKHVVERGCFIFPPFCISSQMEIVDLTSGMVQKISTVDDDFHSPVLSPDGKYAAVLTGAGYGDACSTGLGFAILEFRDSGIMDQINFDKLYENQLPFDNQYAQGTTDKFGKNSINWTNQSTLEVDIHFSDCSDRYGIYQIDLSEMTIEKIDE